MYVVVIAVVLLVLGFLVGEGVQFEGVLIVVLFLFLFLAVIVVLARSARGSVLDFRIGLVLWLRAYASSPGYSSHFCIYCSYFFLYPLARLPCNLFFATDKRASRPASCAPAVISTEPLAQYLSGLERCWLAT